MSEELEKKAKETYETYNKLKNAIEQVTSKIYKLEEENDKIKANQTKIAKELASQNVLIEQKKEERENIINSAGGNRGVGSAPIIDMDHISMRCKPVIDYFIGPINSKYSNSGSNLFFNIKSDNITITKKLEDPTITFDLLKKEVAMQFNKSVEDVYFTDENDNMMLDSMIVKNTLFPLDNITIKDYVPTIKIINPRKMIEESKDSKKSGGKNDNVLLEEEKIKGFWENVSDYFKAHVYHIVHFIFLIIFIFLFIFATIDLRDIESSSLAYDSFKYYTNIHFSKSLQVSLNFLFLKKIQRSQLLTNLQDALTDMFDFPNFQELSNGAVYQTQFTNSKQYN